MFNLTKASAIELPLPVRRFPVFTCLYQVKPMEKPVDRTKQAGPAGAACRSYPDQMASIGFTYEHERWALTMASTVVRWRWVCTCSCVPECVQVSGMPKAMCAEGRGHQPTSTALGRQQAGRLHVAHSHATQSARIACNNTRHTPSKIPQTWSHRACNMPWVHSHYLSPNSSHLPIPLPLDFPQNQLSQYKQPCIRAKRVSSIQLDWSYRLKV